MKFPGSQLIRNVCFIINVLIKADPFFKDLLAKSELGEVLNSYDSAELSRIALRSIVANRDSIKVNQREVQNFGIFIEELNI